MADIYDSAIGTMERFVQLTKVGGIRNTDSIPETIGGSRRAALLARKTSSWYQDGDGTVYVYTPNITGFDIGYWQCQVLAAAVERLGLGNLFVSAVEEGRLVDLVNASGLGRYDSIEELERHLRDVKGSPVNYQTMLQVVTKAFADYFELDKKFVSTALRRGLDSYLYRLSKERGPAPWEGAREGASSGAQKVDLETAEYIDFRGPVSLGLMGEPYRRMGYPTMELTCAGERLQAVCAHTSGLDTLSAGEIAALLENPLAVYRSPMVKGDGTNSYCVVLDRQVKDPYYGNKFLSFLIDPPAKVVQRFLDRGQRGHRQRCSLFPILLNEKDILFNLNRQDCIMYLKPRGDVNSTVYEVGERLWRNKTIGTASSPVETSGFAMPLLNSVTNIVNNFKNPISSERFFQLYGYERDPVRDELSRRAERESLQRREEVKYVPLDKMSRPLPRGVVSDKERERLFSHGIRNAEDIAKFGFDRLREVAGTDRAVNRIAAWLADQGIYLFPDSYFQEQSFGRPGSLEVRAHLLDSLLEAGRHESLEAPLPVRMDGGFYTGSDSAHLLAVGSAPAFGGCPVWATEKELMDIGCVPGKARPVPIDNGGAPVNVYNLSSTGFPAKYPEEYRRYMEVLSRGRDANGETERYFGALLSGFRGITPDKVDSFVRWMDADDRTGAFVQLRAGKGPSLGDAVGGEVLGEMQRKGKALKMFEHAQKACKRVKGRKNGRDI